MRTPHLFVVLVAVVASVACEGAIVGHEEPAADAPDTPLPPQDPQATPAAPSVPEPPEPEAPTNPLSVPYFYQYANSHEPGGTCGLTSAAMLLAYQGQAVTPDSLYVAFGKPQGQSPGALETLYEAHALYAAHTYTGSEAMIKRQIDAGRPVIVHGYFTGSGHIVVIVGYDATGWIVNDPAGLWAGCEGCGYASTGTATNGRGAHYGYAAARQAISVDGDIWLSTADDQPFSL